MVLAIVLGALVVILLVSLPYWLPRRVVALRGWIFAKVNGDEGISVPGPRIGVDEFLRAYADPAANGRSRGAVLSDLFWYWLAPGPHVHQEHIEAGPRYDEVARITRRILIKPKTESEELTARVAARVLGELDSRRPRLVRLRDAAMPIWAELYYELVFDEPCPPLARRLIVDNADDVVTALKCTGLRHMRRRGKLTEYLHRRIVAGEVAHELPASLSTLEQAWYLQGTFFNTAVVQMSEATAHLLLAIAEHPDVQRRLVADPDDTGYLDAVLDEALRTYPLFGIAHRISSADIELAGTTVSAGSVLCFSYPDFHHTGFTDPDEFRPDRWAHLAAKDVNFIPFGVTANRPCPARGLAPVTMRVVTREVLARFELTSSVPHTRSMPNRAPCLLVPRTSTIGAARRRATLLFLRARDRWEDVYRGIAQLGFGSYMVWDARRKHLCRSYFAELDRTAAAPSSASTPTSAATGCPVQHGTRTS
ncbi:MAG TPA: cytochrome P450 [Pseudonocardiaceae bacterium]|jgi:cytochrome P450|nr:cytochrome P450 [Pseudonocardiaceae bacterium]